MLDRRQEYEKMAAVEGALWWYRALHRLVLDAIRDHASTASPRIVDAGCGTGGLATFLRANGFGDLRLFDLSDDAVAWCRERGHDAVRASLVDLRATYPANSADVIVSNDTLCYLDPAAQEDVLRQCAAVLRPGGIVILNLPALAAFSGIHDVSVGIRQRFSRADVPRLLAANGFTVRRACYWPFLLSPLIWATRALQRRRMRRDPQFEVRSDVDLPPRVVNALFGGITRVENRVLPWKPFGSSLFLVGAVSPRRP